MKKFWTFILAAMLAVAGMAMAEEQVPSILSGTWSVGGVTHDGKLYDIHDVAGLEDLYDNTYLLFDENSRFSYINFYISEGECAPFNENRYLLKTENVYRYSIGENGIAKEEVTSDSRTTYLIEFMGDENTLRFGKLDAVTGKIAADDSPLFFVRKDHESQYIAEHKIVVPNNGEKTSSTETATLGERNAPKRAKEYLEVIAFSYSGLIEQLEYEGFSHSEAVYGAEHCGADWYAQAAKKAADYLEIFSFSRSGLIEQLKYEGFTYEQAVYGAEQNGY